MSLRGRLFILFFLGDFCMNKPFLIFRTGNRSALKRFAFLLVCALLLTLAVRLFRLQTEEQGSMEVFAGEERSSGRAQGLYALLEQLLED